MEPLWITVLGFLWVGGGGFIFYRYAALLTRIGLRRETPGRVKFVRIMGIVYMTMACLLIPLEIVMRALHSSR
jgi:hypothetical protein